MHFKESDKPVLINSLVLLTLQLIKVELTATPSVMNLFKKKFEHSSDSAVLSFMPKNFWIAHHDVLR